MKKITFSVLALSLCLLLSSCGKSRADKLMDRYAELANSYSALSAEVAAKNDTSILGSFSSLGIELTDIASSLAKSGDDMTDDALDEIETALDEIETELGSFSSDEAK